jgi:hypothetical protein
MVQNFCKCRAPRASMIKCMLRGHAGRTNLKELWLSSTKAVDFWWIMPRQKSLALRARNTMRDEPGLAIPILVQFLPSNALRRIARFPVIHGIYYAWIYGSILIPAHVRRPRSLYVENPKPLPRQPLFLYISTPNDLV